MTCVRNISSDSTDLKGIMADKIPKEQERIKNFRKAHGATKVGEVTVDMVSALNAKGSRSSDYEHLVHAIALSFHCLALARIIDERGR